MKTTLPLICLILVLGVACDPPGVQAPPKLADQNPHQVGNNDESVQAQPHTDASPPNDPTGQSDNAPPSPTVDEQPLLERIIATPPLQHNDPVQIEASASFCSQDHCYLSFDHNASSVFHINPRSDTHVFAVPDNSRILVRLVSATLPERLELDLYASTSWERWSPVEHTPLVVTTTKASSDQGLQPAFFAALSRWFGQRHPSTPFDAFASGRLSLLGGRNDLNRRPSDLDSLMDLYTGMQSIDEALQIDRGLQLSSSIATAAEPVPFADIQGVALAEHPWEQMLTELGSAPVIEPLASVVPQDVLYLHFHDLRSFVKTASELDEWLAPLSQAVEQRAGQPHFVERYQQQLAVERSALSEKLGHLAASSVALVVGDPFVREGTDVSLLFRVASRELLSTALAEHEANARKARPDATERTLELAGRQVRLLETADGAIRQYRVELGEVLILSNSAKAIEGFILVADKKLPSLAEAGDFRYLRARYPFGTDNEDGYLFIGDALVAKTVGPRLKILEARRMAARADLLAVNCAALLYGWLEGKRPDSVQTLIAAGLLSKEELQHASGGAISFTPERGAWSSWGSVAALTPIADLQGEYATPAEVEAYRRFASGYENYWKQFIDPIGVQIRRSDDGHGLSLDARMLPLISGTDYDELLELVGSATLSPGTAHQGGQWSFAIGADAQLRRELGQLGRELMRNDSISFDWIGDWAMVGIIDKSGLWDLAMLAEAIPTTERPSINIFEPQGAEIISRAPVYAAIQFKSQLGLVTLLAALRSFISGTAPGMVEWAESTPYREIPVVEVSTRDAFSISLFYAMPKDVFVLSLNRAALESFIDDVLDGRAPGNAKPDQSAPQTHLAVAPSGPESWLSQTALGIFEDLSLRSNEEASASYEALARGLVDWPSDAAAQRALALAYFGAEPAGAHGQPLSLDEHGLVSHPLYGTAAEPRLPAVPVQDSPLTKAVQAVELLSSSIAFEGEGLHRGLHVSLEWRRR